MTLSQYKDIIIKSQKDKDIKKAFNLTEEALIQYPDNKFLINTKIYLLYRLNRYNEAKDLALKYFNDLKDDNFFIKNYLLILTLLKDRVELNNFIEYLKNYNFQSIDLYLEIGDIISKLDKATAIDFLSSNNNFNNNEKVLKKIDNLKKESINYSLLKEKLKDKKIEDAISELEELISLPKYSNEIDILNYLGELYKKINNYEKSIEYYKKSLLIKDNPFTRKMLGYLYYKTGDYENALINLKDFLKENPFDNILLSTLSKIYKELNKKNEFIELLTLVLSERSDAKHLYGHIKRAEKWKN